MVWRICFFCRSIFSFSKVINCRQKVTWQYSHQAVRLRPLVDANGKITNCSWHTQGRFCWCFMVMRCCLFLTCCKCIFSWQFCHILQLRINLSSSSVRRSLQSSSYSRTTVVHTVSNFSNHRHSIDTIVDRSRSGNVIKLVKHLFDFAPWLSIAHSHFVCGERVKTGVLVVLPCCDAPSRTLVSVSTVAHLWAGVLWLNWTYGPDCT